MGIIGSNFRLVYKKNALEHLSAFLLPLLQEKKSVKPQFFAFRWITLLLSQEFTLPGILHV